MQSQSLGGEEFAARIAVRGQFALVVAEQGEVIDVAEIARHAQLFFDEVIERVQQHVGKELAGLIANGQSASAFTGSQQVIAGEPAIDRLLNVRMVDDLGHESQCSAVLDLVGDRRFQHIVIDRREELPQVTFQDVAVRASEVLKAVHGGVRSLAFAAGIAVVDERPLEDWFQHVAQRVMDHAIAERGGADHPSLGLKDFKRAVGTGAIRAAPQFVLKLEQLRFQLEAEPGHVREAAFTSGGVPGRCQQILEARQFLPQTAVSFHASLPPFA